MITSEIVIMYLLIMYSVLSNTSSIICYALSSVTYSCTGNRRETLRIDYLLRANKWSSLKLNRRFFSRSCLGLNSSAFHQPFLYLPNFYQPSKVARLLKYEPPFAAILHLE